MKESHIHHIQRSRNIKSMIDYLIMREYPNKKVEDVRRLREAEWELITTLKK